MGLCSWLGIVRPRFRVRVWVKVRVRAKFTAMSKARASFKCQGYGYC
jgi:hypothetical protein